MDHVDAWQQLLASQDGLVTRTQLLRNGISDATLRAHEAAGRWRSAGWGVYATHTGPLSERARRRAAVLAHWPCALSHGTAGEVWGLCPPDPSAPVHVVVAYGASAVSSPTVRVHRSRAFAHVVVGADPPVVSRAHTAVDLAVAEPTPRAAMRTLLHCLVVTSLRPSEVLAALELRRPRRWRAALTDAVRYAMDGVTSTLEMRFTLDVEEAHGLPRPERQVPIGVDGATRYDDVVYRIGDRIAIVRLDGLRYHADRATALTDRRRDTAAQLGGYARLVVGWEEVTQHPCRTAREVGAMLTDLGWTGGLRPCARNCSS